MTKTNEFLPRELNCPCTCTCIMIIILSQPLDSINGLVIVINKYRDTIYIFFFGAKSDTIFFTTIVMTFIKIKNNKNKNIERTCCDCYIVKM